MRSLRRLPLHLVALCATTLLVAACGASSGAGGSTAAATATTPPTATPTVAPTTCAQLSGFGSATPATIPAAFNLPSLPAGTVFANAATTGGGAGEFTISAVDACSPNADTALTETTGKGPKAYTAQIPFYGWDPAATVFPATNGVIAACASGTTCFATNVFKESPLLFQGAPQFFALSNVKDNGNKLITYHLQFAAPPAAPNCGSSEFDQFDDAVYHTHPIYQPYYQAPSGSSPGIQYPPLTRAAGNNAAGTEGTDLCSAGNASTISAIVVAQFTAAGWHTTTNGHCVFATCYQPPSDPNPNVVESWNIPGNVWSMAHHNPNI